MALCDDIFRTWPVSCTVNATRLAGGKTKSALASEKNRGDQNIHRVGVPVQSLAAVSMSASIASNSCSRIHEMTFAI